MPVDSEKDLVASQEPKNKVILSHRFNEVNSEDDEERVSILENNSNDEPYVATIEPAKFKRQDDKFKNRFSKRNSSFTGNKQL